MVGLTQRWAIVLAGGEGERLRPAVKSWFGSPKPKQYCTFTGNRSMFQHTLDRAHRLVRSDHILTVVAKGHQEYLYEQDNQTPGRILVQPKQKDTGVGLLFPLSYVVAADADATVAVLPSDHFIWPEERFLSIVRYVCNLSEQNPDLLILLTAQPDRPETDYGWIQTREKRVRDHPQLRQIHSFLEKPCRQTAQEYYDSGYLWNTMIMVGKASCFWELGKRYMPEVMSRFDLLRLVLQLIEGGRIKKEKEAETLEFIYRKIATVNFSSRVLSHAVDKCLAFPLEGIEWSDWGRPERIQESLARFGKTVLTRHPAASGI
jgi:mannose-1-phosphate guanylyltransferase